MRSKPELFLCRSELDDYKHNNIEAKMLKYHAVCWGTFLVSSHDVCTI